MKDFNLSKKKYDMDLLASSALSFCGYVVGDLNCVLLGTSIYQSIMDSKIYNETI